jgi:alanyl-tRNA synthetase
VSPDRLRFDFMHFSAVSPDQLRDVEGIVNRAVYQNDAVTTAVRDTQEAIAAGATALFGEKYGDKVRVVSVGDGAFSTELCGGTHVRATGDIGTVLITEESGVAAGVRRIEAVSGLGALALARERLDEFEKVRSFLNAKPSEVIDGVRGRLHTLETKVKSLEHQLVKASSRGAGAASDIKVQIGPVTFVARRVDEATKELLGKMADELKSTLETGIVFLAGETPDGQVTMVSAVTPDIAAKAPAGDMVKTLAPIVGGRGGGRPTFAQAGGTNPAKIDELLAEARKLAEKLLA